MTVTGLLLLTDMQLDSLFGFAEAGPMPTGRTRGTVILTMWPSRLLVRALRLVWQGKTFTNGRVRNRVVGLKLFPATATKGPSVYDGLPCIVLDYSQSLPWIRDEIRLLGTGLWLGRMYVGRHPVLHFALEA